jgi:hypothetical protein
MLSWVKTLVEEIGEIIGEISIRKEAVKIINGK